MFRHILVPTDGTPLSLKAAKAAAGLARSTKAKITGIYVMPPFDPPLPAEDVVYRRFTSPGDYESSMRKSAAKVMAKVSAAVAAQKIPFDSVAVFDTHPWQAIIEAARARKCDVVVMASHGRRGLSGLLLGSETQKVLTHSKVPVLVCR